MFLWGRSSCVRRAFATGSSRGPAAMDESPMGMGTVYDEEGVYHTPRAVFRSSIARQPRGRQYRTIHLRNALGEMFPKCAVFFLAPRLIFQLLWRYRAQKIGPGGCDSVMHRRVRYGGTCTVTSWRDLVLISREAWPRERSDRGRFLRLGKKASSYRGAYRMPLLN